MVSIRRGSAKRFCFEESSRVPYHAASPYCGLLWANLIQALLFLLPHLLVLHHAADMALTSDYLFGDLVPRLGASQVWFDTLPLDGSCFCQCGHMSKHCCPFNDVIQFNAIADWRAGQTVKRSKPRRMPNKCNGPKILRQLPKERGRSSKASERQQNRRKKFASCCISDAYASTYCVFVREREMIRLAACFRPLTARAEFDG